MTTQTTKDVMLALMRFGAACLAEHRKDLTDLDGGWLQTLAVEDGLLELRFVNADCGPDCHDEHLFVRKEVLHLLAGDNLMDAWNELCNQRDAAVELLKVSKCPYCDGSAFICQWCDKRSAICFPK